MKLLDKPLGELLAEAEAISIKNGHKLNTMEASIGEIINYVEQFSTTSPGLDSRMPRQRGGGKQSSTY